MGSDTPPNEAKRYKKKGGYCAITEYSLTLPCGRDPALHNQYMKGLLFTVIAAASVAAASADWREEARMLVAQGEPQAARSMLQQRLRAGEQEAGLWLGRMAFDEYDFDGAEKYFTAFRKHIRKASPEAKRDLELYERQLSQARGFLDRVERIVILDSIAVDSETFLKVYRLPASSGELLAPDAIPFDEGKGNATMAFTNENHDFMMWAQPDTLGVARIAESTRLTDGSWSRPVLAPETLNAGGDVDFPFMMSDGVTLYYASDGDESIGGLDIFVASRDAATGEYLQPQNLGMPYNSPADDYMLAIDEENGVGWWATDRNHIPGKVTVYLFKVNDLRRNYDAEEEDPLPFARIADYRATWSVPDGEGTDGEAGMSETDVNELLETVRSIEPGKRARKADFHFPVKGGKMLANLEDFPNAASRTAMKSYLEAEKELGAMSAKLDALRRKYHASRSTSSAAEILKLEGTVDAQREKCRRLRFDVYKSLGSK